MKVTVNGPRYYKEDLKPGAFDACVHALCLYNDLKIRLYNVLYAQRYLQDSDADILTKRDMTYCAWLKETFGINDYYAASLYSDVTGILSSQREFRKWYLSRMEEDLDTRKNKVKSLTESLKKLRAVKQAIVVYAKTGKFKRPYKGCQLKICGQIACPGGKRTYALDEYERDIEQRIRHTKARLHNVQAALNRKEQKFDKFSKSDPKRVLFGSKAFYKTKDTVGCDDRWHEKFYAKRHRTMQAVGRYTGKYGNYLVHQDEKGNLHWILPKGAGTVVFPNFHLSRYETEWHACYQCNKELRQAVSYRMKRMVDGNSREYLIVSATFDLPDHEAPADLSEGCISCDLNVDHLAWAEVDPSGNLLRHGIIPYVLEHKSSTQRDQIIGDVVSRVAALNKETGRPLVFEDLDLTTKRASMKYGGKRSNFLVSTFAYQKFRFHLDSQGSRKGFSVIYVSPAYTSFWGKLLFMRKYGISIHTAAAYCIGLRVLERLDELTIPDVYGHLLDSKKQTGPYYAAEKDAALYKKLSGIRTHAFYLNLPDLGKITKVKEWLRQNDKNCPAWYAAAL